MKQVIRLKTFETNSSSTHTLVITGKDVYENFKRGDLYFSRDQGDFVSEAWIKDNDKNLEDYETFEDFMYDYCDGDYPTYTTYEETDIITEEMYDKNGNEKIVASIYIPG